MITRIIRFFVQDFLKKSLIVLLVFAVFPRMGISIPPDKSAIRQENDLSKEDEKAEATEVEPGEEPEEEIEVPELEKREYLVKPGDVISIIVEDHAEYNRMAIIQSSGKIMYPPLGEIQAVNSTAAQLSKEIATGLSRYLYQPRVEVKVNYRVELDKEERYIIKPGDVIDITVKGFERYNQTTVVQTSGRILYSPLGEIPAAGLDVAQLTSNIRHSLSNIVPNPQINVNVKEIEELPEEFEEHEMEIPPPIQRFGYDFFTGARNRIMKLEETLQEAPEDKPTEPFDKERGSRRVEPSTKDAIQGFVGPADMIDSNVVVTVPAKYNLAPGDKMTIYFWSDMEVDIQSMSLVIDENGEVMIPKAGKIVARGMTLEQFEEAVRELLSRVAYKNLRLIATLDRLRSIQVFITGEVFRPGSYNVSAVTTMFNALYKCGGPSENGSLRNIKLLRNKETKSVDFYRFLMEGYSDQDYTLNAGDTIFIPQVGRIATISGEVKRPAIYELKEGENLVELISLAGGIRPSGFLQRVQIDSVKPGRERVVMDIDLSDPSQADTPIFDGDTVTVFSIPSERMNTVTIEGKVQMPGSYELKDGMTISDLIKAAQGILGEAYTERADLLRLNTDKKTTRLIPINLTKAFAGESDSDLVLQQWDRLVVYSKWDVGWIADRIVSVNGAIQHPGAYERSDDMTISDLLMKAGGALPDAYLDRALLMRLDERGKMTESVPLSLKGPEMALKLEDGDALVIYTYEAARWEPKREVAVEGAIQNPNVFPRTNDMKVADLIHIAGGLLPEAYPDRALLLRMDNRQRVTQGFFVSPKLALQNDARNNLELRDGDRLKIYKYQEAVWEPERKVTISGAVNHPGHISMIEEPGVGKVEAEESSGVIEELLEEEKTEETEYPSTVVEKAEEPQKIKGKYSIDGEAEPKMGSVFERVDNMRVSDLLHRAGGLLPNAYLERADLRRFSEDHETYITIPVNLAKVLSGDKEADILLQDEDVLTVYTIAEAEYKPDDIVTIYGAVQRPDVYIRTVGMRLSDLLFAAGGLLPSAHKNAEVTRIDDNGSILIHTVDIAALLEGNESQNILLNDGDVVSVRKDNDFSDLLRIVTIEGEVKYPGRYTLKRDERLNDLIKRAGGLLDRAYPEASVITRKPEYLTEEEQRKSAQQVKKLIDIINDNQYRRESAKARLIEERRRDQEAQTEPTSPMAVAGTEAYLQSAVTAVSAIPEQTEAAISDIEEITRPQFTLVTPARKIDSLLPTGQVVVNLKEAMSRPGGENDIILEDGDKIVIPSIPFTVSVSGAVVRPSSLIYIKGKKVKDYIKMVGGYSRDADKEAIYTVKSNGMVLTGDKSELCPGDMIIVPTKVEVQTITDRWGQTIGAFKFVATTAATVIIFKLILDRV